MKRLALLVLFAVAIAVPRPLFAQTGGAVTVKAVDTSTFATTDVGDNTNHALRVNIVAGAGSGGTALTDNTAFTQGTTNTTPASGLFKAAYTAATDGRVTVWRMNSTGSGYVNLDTIGNTSVVTGGVAGLLAVGGPVASGSANADNPVKAGGAFNTTQPTVTTGQIVDFQATARGAQIVATGVDAFAVNATQTGTWTVQPGNTANTTQWLVKAGPFDACGTTTYDPAPVKIPDATLDVLTATTTCVDTIAVTNVGSAQATITLQDTQGTPVQLLNALALAPGATSVLNLGGMKFASGIKYQASASNTLSIWVKGRQ
jgi:hypothetical protein